MAVVAVVGGAAVADGSYSWRQGWRVLDAPVGGLGRGHTAASAASGSAGQVREGSGRLPDIAGCPYTPSSSRFHTVVAGASAAAAAAAAAAVEIAAAEAAAAGVAGAAGIQAGRPSVDSHGHRRPGPGPEAAGPSCSWRHLPLARTLPMASSFTAYIIHQSSNVVVI